MASNSTTKLNAKRLPATVDTRRANDTALGFVPSAIQSSVPPVRIVGSRAPYRGGYHLSI